MMSVQDTLRERAAALLASGEVSCFVGWESGRFENQTTPLVCSAPEAAERLVFDEYCVNNLAKYVLDLKARGKVGLVVRGCDARAIQRMMDDNQIKREDVYLIGVGCPTMKDRKTGTILNKCKYCQHRNPHLFDEMAGGPTVDESGEGRFEQAELVAELACNIVAPVGHRGRAEGEAVAVLRLDLGKRRQRQRAQET